MSERRARPRSGAQKRVNGVEPWGQPVTLPDTVLTGVGTPDSKRHAGDGIRCTYELGVVENSQRPLRRLFPAMP